MRPDNPTFARRCCAAQRSGARHRLVAWIASCLQLGVSAGVAACDGSTTPAADSGASVAGDAIAGDAAFDALAEVYAPGIATGATARVDLSGKDWHALPFPIDTRRDSQGVLDLTGFPAPREGKPAPLLTDHLAFAASELRGFSIQPTVFVAFDAPLDPKALPGPIASKQAGTAIALVDVDAASPSYGQAVAVRAKVSPPQRGQYQIANLLMVQPVWGQPLRPLTTYALIVRRGLRDAAGKVLGQPKALEDLFGAWAKGAPPPAALGALDAAFAPLRKAIGDGKVAVPYQDIAAATVFTTGNPAGQLRGMAEWVRKSWQPDKATDWKIAKKTSKYWLLEARYHSPNFQQGKCPYDDDGTGGFVFDAQGNPKVQVEESLRVSVMVPLERTSDVGGSTPIAMSAHGTGGNWLSYVSGGQFKIGTQLATQGLAIASIDQPLHGPRCDPPIAEHTVLDLKTFNFLNIAAGRSGFRQSALDSVAMARMIRSGLLDVPAEWSPDGKVVHFDPMRIAFIGHSQGGLSGALLAAIESDVRAFVLSGAGAGLSLTIMQRKDPGDIAKLVASALGLDDGEISEFHPAIALVQMLADATDPLAYGEFVFARPAGVKPPHILLTEGVLDKQTPADTSEALAAAIGLDVLAPKVNLNDAMIANGTKVLTAPVQNNVHRNGFDVTGVVSQWAGLDHFAIFTTEKVAKLYTWFLLGAAQTGVAVAMFD